LRGKTEQERRGEVKVEVKVERENRARRGEVKVEVKVERENRGVGLQVAVCSQ
jgi:hypothetical protein